MTIIKDKDYWKIYNQKRKAKGYFQQNYLQKKQVVKNGEEIVNNLEVVKSPQVVKNNLVVKSEVVVKNENLQPAEILQPKEEVVKIQENILQPCSRCPEIENSISNFANLYQQEQDQAKEQKKINYQLEKKVKELEIKIISLQETNQILRKDLGYWQDKQLEKELQSNKEIIKKLQTERQQLIEKYSKLENNSKNPTNSLSMPNLYALINKHKKFQTIQRIYNQQEVKEREFLKNLLNQLWEFA